jgi:flagellar hook-length control protein FliK
LANAPASQRGGSASPEGEGFSALVDSNASSDDDRRPSPATPRPAAAQAPAAPPADRPRAENPPATTVSDKPKPTAQGSKADKTTSETADAPADDSAGEASVADTTATTGLDITPAAVAVAAPQAPAATQAEPAADTPAGIAATAIARVTAETGVTSPAAEAMAGDADTGDAAKTPAAQAEIADAETAAASAQKSVAAASNAAAAGKTAVTAQDLALAPVAETATDVIKATKNGANDHKAEPKPADAPQGTSEGGEKSASETKTATPVAAESPRHQASANGAQERPASDQPRAESGAGRQDHAASSTLAHNTADFANQLQLGAAQAPSATVTAATPQLNAMAATTPQLPVQAIAAEITANVQIGRSRFEIRLDPPELGRIDVRLDVDRQGNVTSHLIVEKASTLDVLRRDAQQLERALQDAGLKTSDNSLQFSLRDQQQQSDRQAEREPPAQRLLVADEETTVAEAAGRTYGRMIGLRGGLDIRV